MSINSTMRNELIVLARRPKAQICVRPRWQPEKVHNPNGVLGDYFNDASAWDLIASHLEAGCEVDTVTLRKPPGKTAYVLKIDLETNEPELYVKVELRSGEIVGRSFHYTNHQERTGNKHGNTQSDRND